MFCMNCGQKLPDGAKFCLNCGTPQGAVSQTGNTKAETINLDSMHTFVPAMCPNCNAHMKVDTSSKVARCDTCGTECLVQDAIKALNVRGNVQVGSATINVSGTNTDSLLQRVEIMLGDGDFGGAMSKCDTILDSDPTNGKVYFYLLMANLRCRTRNELANQQIPFVGNYYYSKVIQYGDENLKAELIGYINAIKSRNEEIRKREEELRKREEEENAAKLKNPKVGDVFFFGTYNGRRIPWKVLCIQDHMALIISYALLERASFHRSVADRVAFWAECSLRKWLNEDFVNGCFTPEECARIHPYEIKKNKNPKHFTVGGPPSINKVFLLSIQEANEFFATDQERIAYRLDLVDDHFHIKYSDCHSDNWWLRSPGDNLTCAAIVSHDGRIYDSGNDIHWDDNYVRPALWLKFDG